MRIAVDYDLQREARKPFVPIMSHCRSYEFSDPKCHHRGVNFRVTCDSMCGNECSIDGTITNFICDGACLFWKAEHWLARCFLVLKYLLGACGTMEIISGCEVMTGVTWLIEPPSDGLALVAED